MTVTTTRFEYEATSHVGIDYNRDERGPGKKNEEHETQNDSRRMEGGVGGQSSNQPILSTLRGVCQTPFCAHTTKKNLVVALEKVWKPSNARHPLRLRSLRSRELNDGQGGVV